MPFSVDMTFIQTEISFAILVIAIAGSFITLGYFRAQITEAHTKAERAQQTGDRAVKEISEFKEKAAAEFVTVESLHRFETRLEEFGREMRSGLDGIRNKMIELFANGANGKRPHSDD